MIHFLAWFGNTVTSLMSHFKEKDESSSEVAKIESQLDDLLDELNEDESPTEAYLRDLDSSSSSSVTEEISLNRRGPVTRSMARSQG